MLRPQAQAAAYMRASTSGQDPENQRADIERAAASRGDGELVWFVDTGSGRAWKRPELDKLSAAIFRGEVGRVYVWKIDRLSRMGIGDTFRLVEEWRRAGMRDLLSAAEGFDFGDPVTGDLRLAMVAWAARWEWDQQQDRLAISRRRRAAAGKGWGRPPKNPGMAGRIHELRAEGRSIRAISMALKVPKSTVHEALKCPVVETTKP